MGQLAETIGAIPYGQDTTSCIACPQLQYYYGDLQSISWVWNLHSLSLIFNKLVRGVKYLQTSSTALGSVPLTWTWTRSFTWTSMDGFRRRNPVTASSALSAIQLLASFTNTIKRQTCTYWGSAQAC